MSDRHRPRRRRGHPARPTGRCCWRSARRARPTPATGNSPAASSSPANRRARRSIANCTRSWGCAVRRAAPWLVAALRLSARARRAPLLPRLRVGRRAGRPRRPGVRVADARALRRRAAAAGQHARCCARCVLPPVYGITMAGDLGEAAFLARARVALDARPRADPAAREGLAARRGSARWPMRCWRSRRRTARRCCSTAMRRRTRAPGAAPACTGRAAALAAATARPAGMLCAASCHTREDIARAGALGLDFVVLGPVLPTPTHPDAPPLGWDGFAAIAAKTRDPGLRAGRARPATTSTPRSTHGAHGVALRRGAWRLTERPSARQSRRPASRAARAALRRSPPASVGGHRSASATGTR